MSHGTVFSYDAETDGLWGQPFAIAATVVYRAVDYANGGSPKEFRREATFVAYLGPNGVTDQWVRDNVLPKLGDLEVTHASYDEMLADFARFYLKHKGDKTDVIAHMGVPVEARVLLDMHARGFIGDWDGPFPFLDVASILKSKGFDPTSVDSYNKEITDWPWRGWVEGLNKRMAPHHPLYDAEAAAIAYTHLMR